MKSIHLAYTTFLIMGSLPYCTILLGSIVMGSPYIVSSAPSSLKQWCFAFAHPTMVNVDSWYKFRTWFKLLVFV